MNNHPNYDRVKTLIDKQEPYSDAELRELLLFAPYLTFDNGQSTLLALDFKVNINLLRAIVDFDNSSAQMVGRGNTINKIVLTFAILAFLVGAYSLVLSWKSYQATLLSLTPRNGEHKWAYKSAEAEENNLQNVLDQSGVDSWELISFQPSAIFRDAARPTQRLKRDRNYRLVFRRPLPR